MQFKGKPTGTFRSDACWHAGRMDIEFTLDLRDDEGDHFIRCRVSREALNDAAHRSGPLDGTEALQLFERLKHQIYAAVDRKLKAGQFDGDGSITVRSADLDG